MIAILPYIVFLLLMSLLLLYFFGKKLSLSLVHMLRFFVSGICVAVILKLFLYSIGREMSVDLYFFQIQIVAKDAFGNFENSYALFLDRFSLEYTVLFWFGVTVLPAILEEIGKFLSFRLRVLSNLAAFHSVRDYIYSMFAVGLGFSFMENILYTKDFLAGGASYLDTVHLLVLRVLLSTTSHMLFSGIVAYYFARYVFGRYDLVDTKFFATYHSLVAFLKKIHLFHNGIFMAVYRVRLLFVGLVLAIGAHIVYNMLISMGWGIGALAWLLTVGCIFFVKVLMRRDIGMNIARIQQKIQILKESQEVAERRKEIFGDGKE